MFSSKHLDYLNWKEYHNMRISKQYQTLEGTLNIIYLKNSMNTKRTLFN
jgi:hypothetical protein